MTPPSREATRAVAADPGASPGHGATASARQTLEARFPPGTMLGARYRIVGLLGRGGMGQVYRADDLKLGRAVALKFLPPEVERDAELLGRFLDEVRMAVRVSHPNVCRVHDIEEADGLHFISMEYVDGEDLAALLRRIGRLPQDKAIQVARQLCGGLAAAHDQGILHRDLKPANVMLDGRGQVKITDFGLARLAGELHGAEVRAGTPAYMAPEQIDGGQVTVRTDVYSLGMVLYEVFTGGHAFNGVAPAERGRGRATPPVSPSSHFPGIDPAVERVVLRCLAIDSRDRPASTLAVASALPGGDPLAAALAAGETPSPELVAEAGSSVGLSPVAATLCLAGALAATALMILLSGRMLLVRRVTFDKPPEALAEDAREAIRAAGWRDPPADSLFGFLPNWSYLGHLQTPAPAGDQWDTLREDRPAGVLFAYRQSPRLLERLDPEELKGWMSDPAPALPGMVEARLSPKGRLTYFAAVPPELSDASAPPAEPDWRPLFAAADLDPAAFTETEPLWSPRSFADRRVAWKGAYPGAPGSPIRVEAASYRGRPVSFRIVEPWTTAAGTRASAPGFWTRARDLVNTFWFGVVLVGAALVAARNVRLGRGDRASALRLALYLGAARVFWMIGAHHLPALSEREVVTGTLAWALYLVGLVYVFYLALEPYARRLWPRMLVSWVRLLGGNLRDPLVGRDLLFGVLYGSVHALVFRASEWSQSALLGEPYPLDAGGWSLEALRGLRHALAAVLAVHVESVLFAFFGVTMFLVLRVVLRRTWAAVAAWTALAVVLFNPGAGSPWPYLISALFLFTAFWVVLFRAGLLSVVTGLSLAFLLRSFPLTFDLSAWYAEATLLVLPVVLGVALWGFRTALAGRPIFRDEIAPARAATG